MNKSLCTAIAVICTTEGEAWRKSAMVDFSCADEVVAKLVAALHELPVTRVILFGVREDQAEAIDHALSRVAQGQLGRCETCGREIPIARLRALPSAALCVRCASVPEMMAR